MKITLIESDNDFITRVINEEILNEGLSDVLYHGTYIPRLKNILDTNTINLTVAVGSQADLNKNKNNEYFFSTQRANGLSGYIHKNGANVILKLDGQKLNQNYKGYPINYWEWSMDKKDYDSNSSYMQALQSKEFEDRIVSKEPEIPNANKYITEIHIYRNTNHAQDKKEFLHMLANAKNLRIPTYVYLDYKDFKALNKKKAVKSARDLEYKKDEFAMEKGTGKDIGYLDLATILAIPILNTKYSDAPEPIFKELFPDWNDDEIEYLSTKIKEKVYLMKNGYDLRGIQGSLDAAIHNNRSSSNQYMRKGLHYFVKDYRNANVDSLKQYVDKMLEENNNLSEESFGYRAGSIEGTPPETLGNFRGGRGTGHFGTGWYFFGDEGQAQGYAKPGNVRYGDEEDTGENDREINAVDFDKYKLLRVKDNLTGLDLHTKLKAFEGTNIKAWTNNYNGLALASIFYKKGKDSFGGATYNNIDEKVTNTLVPELKTKLMDFAKQNINAIVDEVNSDEFYQEHPEEKKDASDMDFDIEYDLRKDELNQYVYKFIGNYLQDGTDNWGDKLEKPRVGYSDIYNTSICLDFLNQEIVNKMTEMINKRTKGEVYIYWMGRRVDELVKIVSKIDTSRDEGMMKNILLKKIPSLLRRDPYLESHMGKTTFGTELIKALGYNGIDVRGVGESQGTTGMDNSQYGSVIYDLQNTK